MESVIYRLGGTPGLGLITGSLFVVGYFLWADGQATANSPYVLSPAAGLPNDGAASLAVPETINRPPVAGLPSPREQQASRKLLVEGHWHGMELITLTPELARLYGVSSAQAGLLVDEVTLEAAESGMLAGDVLYRLDSLEVATLPDFREATYLLRNHHEVEMHLLRGGKRLSVMLRTRRGLGAAMFESAPPVLPGAIPPHKDKKRPCTDCHLIMSRGGQLAVDAGDLLPSPPAIAANARPTHGDRGPCRTCHRIVGQARSDLSVWP